MNQVNEEALWIQFRQSAEELYKKIQANSGNQYLFNAEANKFRRETGRPSTKEEFVDAIASRYMQIAKSHGTVLTPSSLVPHPDSL
jgi:hypothetical protein